MLPGRCQLREEGEGAGRLRGPEILRSLKELEEFRVPREEVRNSRMP